MRINKQPLLLFSVNTCCDWKACVMSFIYTSQVSFFPFQWEQTHNLLQELPERGSGTNVIYNIIWTYLGKCSQNSSPLAGDSAELLSIRVQWVSNSFLLLLHHLPHFLSPNWDSSLSILSPPSTCCPLCLLSVFLLPPLLCSSSVRTLLQDAAGRKLGQDYSCWLVPSEACVACGCVCLGFGV